MSSAHRHRPVRPGRPGLTVASVVLALVGSLLALPGPLAARTDGDPAPGADLLPDMRLLPLYGVKIQSTADGRRLLRFGTRAVNVGDGPLEVRGRARDERRMTEIYQWIADDLGGGREVHQPAARMFWSGDGHSHWHVREFITVEVYKPESPDTTRRIRKLGFCLMDSMRVGDRPNSPTTRGYGPPGCGTQIGVDSLAMGISVGWADDYPPMIRYQLIDITRMGRGVHILCAKVNPRDHWLEAATGNNYFWQELDIKPWRGEVTVLSTGRTPCGSHS